VRRVYLDACIVIYLLEKVEVFSDAAMAHLARNPEAELCVSALVRLEVLAKPMRDGNLALASDYEEFLAAQNWLVIHDAIFDLALRLRVQHGLKTPDALHLATAMHYRCVEFWTNDDRLKLGAGPLAVNILGKLI